MREIKLIERGRKQRNRVGGEQEAKRKTLSQGDRERERETGRVRE